MSSTPPPEQAAVEAQVEVSILGQLCMKGDVQALRSFLLQEEEEEQQDALDLTAAVSWMDQDDKALESPPLFICIDYGHIECVRLLLDIKTDLVNTADENDYTPAQWAAWKGHVEILQLLINRGAIIDQHSLDMAQEEEENGGGPSAGVVELIRQHMDPYAALAGDEDEILMKACREGDLAKVTNMLADGYDYNKWKTAEDGKYQLFSPMHMAVKRGHFEIVQLFMDKGVQLEMDGQGGEEAPVNTPNTNSPNNEDDTKEGTTVTTTTDEGNR